jgi:hypothetical protein
LIAEYPMRSQYQNYDVVIIGSLSISIGCDQSFTNYQLVSEHMVVQVVKRISKSGSGAKPVTGGFNKSNCSRPENTLRVPFKAIFKIDGIIIFRLKIVVDTDMCTKPLRGSFPS